MKSSGIKYSNSVALHDRSVGVPSTLVTSRPRWNQCVSGQVALGDADEARQPRFRGQEVVVGRVEAARPFGVGQTIADGEDPALRVVEEAEAHPVPNAAARRERARRCGAASQDAKARSRARFGSRGAKTAAAQHPQCDKGGPGFTRAERRGPGGGRSTPAHLRPRSPSARVMSAPARLPLSTVDT